MNTLPDSVIVAFKNIRMEPDSQEKYLSLLYLKIYRGHLQCCRRGFELRFNFNVNGIDSISDPLLYEYNLLTKQFDATKRIEMITSGIAEIWVEKNNRLLNDDQILQEIKLIRAFK
jgi:hypothetical protein